MNIMSYQSIPAVLKENATKYAQRTAISYKEKGAFLSLTYAEFYERVLMLARGLRKAGMVPGDKVAIFSENRLGWAISDFGIQSVGGVTVPIYATNTGKQAAYILNHAESRIVFCSTKKQYEKLLAVQDQIPGVELVITYEGFMGDRCLPVYTLSQLTEAGTPLSEEDTRLIEEQIDRITQEDLITIIYTSGTTGTPKGVQLTQRNIMINAQYGVHQLGMEQKDQTLLSFLPLSHVLERTAGYYATLMTGGHIAFAESAAAVMQNMAEFKPTSMVSVPRLFEKIHSKVYDGVQKMPPYRREIFNKAVEVGREYVNKRYVLKEQTGLLGVKYRLFDRLVFKKIRDRFGGRLQYFLCGGAPLDKTVNEFMWILGIPVYNGYGLTETSPGITLSGAGNVRFDSVGKFFPETEVKLADDGELQVKGPQVMRGYYKNDEATAEGFEDGWFKTGDIARIDEEGFVYIVDRKKELIVTAGGKNIAPQPIENELRLDPYISQAIVIGDMKPYLVAFITPDIERVMDLAREESIPYSDVEELLADRRIKEVFAKRIEELNKNYPPYKTIKRFALLPRDFSIEGGELTPTLKLKRKVIFDKYKDIVDDLYLGDGNGIIAQHKKN